MTIVLSPADWQPTCTRKGIMKILLAVDETPASQLAIEEIASRPWPEGTVVEVLTVVEQGQMWSMSETLESAYHLATDLVTKSTAFLRAAGIPSHGNVATGDPKSVILERADDTKPDLIVVGSHRVNQFTHFFLGNVAAHTLRHAEASVAVVRPRLDAAVQARRVLLATDGSAYSEIAARAIAARPWPVRTEVRILSVVEVILPTIHALFEPPFVHSGEVQKLREEALARAQKAVADAAAILAPTGLDVSESVSVLLDGTKDVILHEARDWWADWIFLGSHGRRGARRFLMGSVSESLAAQATCSVEVVRTRAN
ncbi:MAG: universal stress protein [Bryobacterales bacterium]|nr:universal stress protein [Bryobacterales bacterium]